jgi:hypothetical protein
MERKIPQPPPSSGKIIVTPTDQSRAQAGYQGPPKGEGKPAAPPPPPPKKS